MFSSTCQQSSGSSADGSVRWRVWWCLVLVGGWLILLAGMAPAQSGRRPAGRAGTTSPARPGSIPDSPSKSPSDNGSAPAGDERPLADTTPVSIDDEGTIRFDTSLVTIPVTVLDRQGRLITDLRKGDFQLYEDGVEQRIDSLQALDLPFNVVLMIDTSGSTRFRLEDIQAAALAFVNQLKGDDRVMVVSFAQKYRVECGLTSDRNELREAIYRTRTGGGTKLYEAVDFVLGELERVEGRKAVVLFTDGVDTSSRRASAGSTIERATESGALFYPISYDTQPANGTNGRGGRGTSWPGGPPIFNPVPRWPGSRRWPFLTPYQWPIPGPSNRSGDAEYLAASRYLAELAESSGGRLAEAGTLGSVSSAFSRIAEELRQQYVLGYYPSNSEKNGTWRQIRVRIAPGAGSGNNGLEGGWVVRARKGYRAEKATAIEPRN
jgi:Ca-activated chloride channel family protein